MSSIGFFVLCDIHCFDLDTERCLMDVKHRFCHEYPQCQHKGDE